ncbi:hypothetical protein GCG54_00014655 [Colletotrichum gloeosporioides]|uniref:Uncharacterized protein n=1 Tax=Colletotrichum gloeosporioides TaxID=474922 RepID=A0A8H4FGX8_COLGL|nr:uncharacterized protein GCG54_00014655 [Colletotrichum gloeosporioides]KAF3801441.1 hypothetical protein GCG54_00014655 [Colletotrichum gloeosporioides]
MDKLLASVQQNAEASYGETTEATLSLWEDMVSLYSRCKLTKSEDKLLAFAGVAKAFQELTGDTYLAGVWRSQLLVQLKWTVFKNERAAQVPKRYRAPSWSWASVDSPVRLWFTKQSLPQCENHLVLEVLDAGATSNAFEGMADVSDAWLEVRGTCFECSYEKQEGMFSLLRPDFDIGVELEAMVIVDATEYEFTDESRTTLLLYMVVSWEGYWYVADAMILLPISGSRNVYKRIGWAHFRPRDAKKSPADQMLSPRIEKAELLIV